MFLTNRWLVMSLIFVVFAPAVICAEPDLSVLNTYADDVLAHGSNGFSHEEATEWVSLLSDELSHSEDVQESEQLLVAIMSLYSWLGQWDSAIDACNQAYAIAENDATRLNRLLNRFAIEDAQARNTPGHAREAGGRVLDTYKKINSLFQSIMKNRSDDLDRALKRNYFTAAERASRIAVLSGDQSRALKIRYSALWNLGSPEIFADSGVSAMRFRYMRVRLGAMALANGDVESAVDAMTIGTAVPSGSYEWRGAYLKAVETRTVDPRVLDRFVRAAPVPNPPTRDSLALVAEHGSRILSAAYTPRIIPSDTHGNSSQFLNGVNLSELAVMIGQQVDGMERRLATEKYDLLNTKQRSERETLHYAKSILRSLYMQMGQYDLADQYIE